MNDGGSATRDRGASQPPHVDRGAAARFTLAALAGLALALALGLRFVSLDRRPMHHDEANQAVKFGLLLETGRYQYDPADHHGPTLYYLTLPLARLRGQASLAALDERTLRSVPACFGVGLPLLFLVLWRRLGGRAVASAMLLAALSPALVYYSRFYIQEAVFAFFTVACLIAAGLYWERPSLLRAAAAGGSAGLVYATKETFLIVLPAIIAAVVVAHRWPGPRLRRPSPRPADAARPPVWPHAVAALSAALGVAWLFFSSFFTHPAGFLDSLRALGGFVERGTEGGLHGEPWHYYLQVLGWSSSGGVVWTEAAVLVLALVGLAAAWKQSDAFWERAIATYTLLTTAVFSALPYKTPWNILPFYAGVVLLAGIGAGALSRWAGRQRPPVTLAFAMLFTLACAHLGWESWRAIGPLAADPRNPYVYAQTSPDFLRLVRRVQDLAALDAEGERMLVKVIAGPHEQWPLPWYLRRMSRVGYWTRPADAEPLAGTPVIVASLDHAETIDAELAGKAVSEMYGLRPGVFLTLFVEPGRWERFIATRR